MVFYLENLAEKNEAIDSKTVMSHFTVDAIATCGFGIETNSFADPNSTFRKMVSKFTNDGKDMSKTDMFKMILFFVAPKLAKLLKIQFLDAQST